MLDDDAVGEGLDEGDDGTEVAAGDPFGGAVAVEETVGAHDPQVGVVATQDSFEFFGDVGELEDALRTSQPVAALRAPLEALVSSGELSALEASEQILAAFYTDLAGRAAAPADPPEPPGPPIG